MIFIEKWLYSAKCISVLPFRELHFVTNFYKKTNIFFTWFKAGMINTVQNYSIPSFKGYSPTRKFDLTKIDDIPCAYCGGKMFSLSKFDIALNEARTHGKMFRVGQEYSRFLTPVEREILDFPLLFSHPKGLKYAIRNLLMPHASTIEHIRPQSKGGTDDLSNFMAACYLCNGDRKSIPLPEMIAAHPEIPQNVQNHVNYLKSILPELIRCRKISPEYANYLQMLSKTLKKESEGFLNITV